MKTLVWYRSDLRVADHAALHEAVAESSAGVTALFVATPEQWRRHDWGPPKVDFVLRSVAALAGDLARLGIPLRVETCPGFAELPELVARVARETGSDRVAVHRELEVNETRRDAAVAERLERESVAWREHHDQTIIPPWSLRTGEGETYRVFTPFHRAWVRELDRSGLAEPLPPPAPVAGGTAAATIELPDREDPGLRELWPAGEREARRRLDAFLSGAVRLYHHRRDDPTRESTSSLSPYLAVGALSARSALWAGLEANRGRLVDGEPGIAAWLRQLAWRDFYRHVLAGFPRVSMNRPFRPETEGIEWRRDPEALAAWCEGRTGFPIVDAAMRALAATGWMHNRLRMITAAFLTKDLLIDWREGERHFARSLVDTDLANNNGGWQWAASTGTDAAPWFRIFNPWRQSERFDPEGRFIRRWLPELGSVPVASLHDPVRLAAARDGTGYAPPIVDHRRARERALAAYRGL